MDVNERGWLEGIPDPSDRAAMIVYEATADAHGYGLDRPAPCSRCGTPSPAAEPAECDDPACPLEGEPW